MLASLAATCDDGDDGVYDCGEESVLYEQRIAPLLAEERPKSCNQCHLSGIDLALFVKDNACNSMACMVQRGLVDLEQPADSLILTWIDRAAPASDGITPEVLQQERDGFLQWIEMTARCGTCATNGNPCGETQAGSYDDCGVKSNDPDSYQSYDDPGDCSDRTIEEMFLYDFFPFRGRCYPCHFEGTAGTPDAPRWIAQGPCATASLTTMRRVIDLGVIDVDDPMQSRWLLKPLEESLGGVEHGGGGKIHSLDEEGWLLMSHWVQRYAECNR